MIDGGGTAGAGKGKDLCHSWEIEGQKYKIGGEVMKNLAGRIKAIGFQQFKLTFGLLNFTA